MNNNAKILENGNVQVTKAFMRKAKIFGSAEYEFWKKIKAELPEAKMVTRTSKPKAIQTRNLSYSNMEIFISAQDNAEELLVEFRKIKKISCIQTSPYRSVLAWFLEKFESYDSYKDFLEKLAEEAKRKEAEKENDSAVA